MTPLVDMWEEYDHLAFEEGCYEYDKDECYQNNNTEEQVDIESNQNPQRRKQKRKSRKKPPHGSTPTVPQINAILAMNLDIHSV